MADISINFLGKRFENPFVLSAAPATDNLEMLRNGLKSGWAGAVLKTTSVEGTPVPLKYPQMTSISFEEKRVFGLGNIDLISEHHIDIIIERIKILKDEFPEKIIIPSIMGSIKKDWQTLASRLKETDADMIECSFSCPQGSLGDHPTRMLGQSAEASEMVTGWVKEAAEDMPVIIKITPLVTSIVEIVNAVKRAGADAVTASNSIPALMGVDIDTFVPFPNVNLMSTYSGFSGPAIKPITLRVISEIAKNVDIPISGNGGVMNWKDAVEFMLLGASNVQICSAVMRDGFRIIDDLIDGFNEYLDSHNFKSASEIIGKALPRLKMYEELDYKEEIRAFIDKNLCIKCLKCVISCRDGAHIAIEVGKNRYPFVDDEKCVGCGMCVQVCPVKNCIKMIELKEKLNI